MTLINSDKGEIKFGLDLEGSKVSSDKEIIRRYRLMQNQPADIFIEVFADKIEDEDGQEFNVVITYCYSDVNDFYKGIYKNVVEYNVGVIGSPRMSDDDQNESVRELIRLHAKGLVEFEVSKPKEL